MGFYLWSWWSFDWNMPIVSFSLWFWDFLSDFMKAKEILWMQVGEILKSLTRHDPAPKFNGWILKGGTLRCFTGSFPCPKIWEALQIAAVSLKCPWSWAQCGEVIQNRQLQSELHSRFWWIWLFWTSFAFWCLLISFKYSLSLSLSCLDWDFDRLTGWAVSRDGSLEFPKMKIKIKSGLRKL